MDLNTVMDVARPGSRDSLGGFIEGDAWLAGGTWLFSEPQPHVRRLIDLCGLGWEPLAVTEKGLSIAATCPVATLEAFDWPRPWRAGPLFAQCCNAFLASFKISSIATVGGNLCTALPAGPMISLCAALDGICLIWTREGGERRLPIIDFILGPRRTALQPGELLRAIELPVAVLKCRTAFRRISLTPLGRSAALLIGTLAGDGQFTLMITASTPRPVRLTFDEVPDAATLASRIDAAIPPDAYYDDIHGAPDWRRDLTFELSDEIRAELA